jgi:hypothetical protein
MLGAFGFAVVDMLNERQKVPVTLSPEFTAFFSMLFASFCGLLWEIVEFVLDGLLDVNLQQYRDIETGATLIGRAAVVDTMKDLIVDVLGAIAICVIGYFLIKRRPDNR